MFRQSKADKWTRRIWLKFKTAHRDMKMLLAFIPIYSCIHCDLFWQVYLTFLVLQIVFQYIYYYPWLILLNTQIQLISENFKMEENLVIKLGCEPVSSVTMFQRLTSIICVVKNNRDSYTGKVMILIAVLWCCGKERFVCR